MSDREPGYSPDDVYRVKISVSYTTFDGKSENKEAIIVLPSDKLEREIGELRAMEREEFQTVVNDNDRVKQIIYDSLRRHIDLSDRNEELGGSISVMSGLSKDRQGSY